MANPTRLGPHFLEVTVPLTTALGIVEYLAEKGIRTWKASGPEVTAWCFFCGRHHRDRGRLYINADEGVYYCQVCQASGTFNDIQEHFGDSPGTVVAAGGGDYMQRRRILRSVTEAAHETLLSREDVLAWLMGKDRRSKQRGLSVDTIARAKFGFLAKGWDLTKLVNTPHVRSDLAGTGLVYPDGRNFFTGPKVIIPYLASGGGVVQIRGRDWSPQGDGKYQTGPGENVRLYGADDLRGAEDAIIVEGEFDREVVKQTIELATSDDRLRRMAVVGIPGAGAFPKEWIDYFRSCRRVYVALDPDEAGKKGALKIKDALGTKARVVELPDDLPKCDWTEYIVYRGHGWKDVRALLDNANNVGRRLFLFSESHDAWQRREVQKQVVPTGWKEIDAAIADGGLPPGSVTVVAAKTGVGKTLVACNVVVNHVVMGLDVPTLFVSMEMPREDLAERITKAWRFHNPRTPDDQLLDYLDTRLLICDENRLQNRDITALIEEFAEERGEPPKFVVIDHLQYLSRQQNGRDSYERTTNAIQEMKAVAKEAQASLMVPSQVNRIAKDGQPIDADSMRDSGAVEETADYLITWWRPDDALEPGEMVERTAKLQASFEKNRRGQKKQRFALQMALSSLAIVDAGGAAAFAATAENRKVWAGKSYEEIRAEFAQTQLAVV